MTSDKKPLEDFKPQEGETQEMLDELSNGRGEDEDNE